MGKNRKSKRQLLRDEKRAKKRGRENNEDEERDAKRQRNEDGDEILEGTNEPVLDPSADFIPLDDGADLENQPRGGGGGGFSGAFDREFFGMLAEQEQEYFRHADELLELNDFPSAEEREIFLQNVYKEARGKELKLASSQSCSRLMERLILLSNTKQKKRLFNAFAGHFISLTTHRFAGHCCEKLFLQAAPVVTRELQGEPEPETQVEEEEEDVDEAEKEALKTPMEDLFLLTLDELEEHLSYLLSDRYGSHALRALLIVLSGRPLNQAGTKSLLQSRKKEYITVEGATANSSELNSQPRTVPSSFNIAIRKIITDSTAALDPTALRVLAKHPTANPALQLLLDLELTLFVKKKDNKKKKSKDADIEMGGVDQPQEAPQEEEGPSLLEKLVPDAPGSFAEADSPASEFVNSMLYDPVGSRLLETLIQHCPGKVFKGLQQHIFGPRIQSLLRNDIASYPAIKVLNRLSKEDLADAVEKSIPQMQLFVDKGRFNVIKTLFERCDVRGAKDQIAALLKALTSANGNDWKHLVPRLCFLNEDDAAEEKQPEESEEKNEEKEVDSAEAAKDKKFQKQQDAPAVLNPVAAAKAKAAKIAHGSQVIATLISIQGQPAKAIQASLIALKPPQLLKMATASRDTSGILVKALTSPAASNQHFHKMLVAQLRPHVYEIATSQHGQAVMEAILAAPTRGEGIAVPFHLKEGIMAQLEEYEHDLRQTWLGRNVWRNWRGDLFSHRRHDWVRWARELADKEGDRVAAVPKARVKDEKKDEGGKDGEKAATKPQGKWNQKEGRREMA